MNNTSISFASFYCPTNSSPTFSKINFTSLINTIPKPAFIAGDFNAHHAMWGCQNTDSRGRDIVDSLDICNLVLLNDGQVTTVGTNTWRPNALDLCLVSPSLALQCEWSVHDDPMGSYHLPTITNISLDYDSVPVIQLSNNTHLFRKRNLRMVNWDIYTEIANTLLDSFVFWPSDSVASYNEFCKIILTAVDETIFRVTGKRFVQKPFHSNFNANQRRKSPPVPWWNEKCASAVKNSKNAYITFKHMPSMENYIEFKRLQALKKKIIKEERKNSWREFCSNLSRLTPTSKIWKTMRKFNKSPSSVHTSGETPPWISDFLCKYTPDFVETTGMFIRSQTITDSNSYLANPFTIDEIIAAIKSRKDTACGLDGVSYKMLQNLSVSNLNKFLDILNAFWNESFIPKEWKIDCLVPILKPNKNRESADSYRPIALTSCFGKVFEQLIKMRLEFYVEHNHLLPNNQFGFRRGFSARESIAHLFLDIHSSINSNKYLAGIFFDITGAFNNVNIDVLCSSLITLGIPIKIVDWVFNFLNGREVFIKYNNNLYGPRFSFKGVCQGGVLSPLLYLLYVYRINSFLSVKVSNLQFADDLVVYCSGSNLQEVAIILNKELQNLQKFLFSLSLEISPSKSKAVIFSKNNIHSYSFHLYYDNSIIPIEDSTKFLGVHFEQNFSWSKYVDCLIVRASRATNILRSITGSNWGADPKILLMLYKALVRSHFEYAFFCYASSIKLIDKTDKIQNQGMRLILGAMNTSPINSMQVECNLPPMLIRFRFLLCKFLLKLFSDSNSTLLSKLQNSSGTFLTNNLNDISQIINKYDIYKNDKLPCYSGNYQSKFSKIVVVINKKLATKYDVLNELSKFPNYRHLYTDGAKNDRNVSLAIYDPLLKTGYGLKMSSVTSIYSAEAYAISVALDFIEDKIRINPECNKWIIISDSMSVLSALANPSFSSKTLFMIYEIREKYHRICLQNIEIVLFWTPSHVGVSGNEEVDALARFITNTPNWVPCKNIKIPISDCIILVKDLIKEKWMDLWDLTTRHKGKWYRQIKSTIGTPWFCKDKYVNRRFYTTICRMRIGHGFFNEHLHRMNLVQSPLCNYCNIDQIQSLDHLLFFCDHFVQARQNLFEDLEKIYKTAESIPRSLQDLLKNEKCFLALCKFIWTTIAEI